MSTQSSSPRAFKVGDTVRVRAEYAKAGHVGATYTVVKINPRTLGCRNVATGGKMNADPECMIHADEADAAPTVTEIPIPTTVESPVPVGAVVKATHLRGQSPDALYVVTGHVTSRGVWEVNHRLSPLGGDARGRYYTGVPKRHLTPLSNEEIATALLESL